MLPIMAVEVDTSLEEKVVSQLWRHLFSKGEQFDRIQIIYVVVDDGRLEFRYQLWSADRVVSGARYGIYDLAKEVVTRA